MCRLKYWTQKKSWVIICSRKNHRNAEDYRSYIFVVDIVADYMVTRGIGVLWAPISRLTAGFVLGFPSPHPGRRYPMRQKHPLPPWMRCTSHSDWIFWRIMTANHLRGFWMKLWKPVPAKMEGFPEKVRKGRGIILVGTGLP